jgi:hypothetical protein
MNKPYNIQNTNICNGVFHISFCKALIRDGPFNLKGRVMFFFLKEYSVFGGGKKK